MSPSIGPENPKTSRNAKHPDRSAALFLKNCTDWCKAAWPISLDLSGEKPTDFRAKVLLCSALKKSKGSIRPARHKSVRQW